MGSLSNGTQAELQQHQQTDTRRASLKRKRATALILLFDPVLRSRSLSRSPHVLDPFFTHPPLPIEIWLRFSPCSHFREPPMLLLHTQQHCRNPGLPLRHIQPSDYIRFLLLPRHRLLPAQLSRATGLSSFFPNYSGFNHIVEFISPNESSPYGAFTD